MTATVSYALETVIGNTVINSNTIGEQQNYSVTSLGSGGAIAVSYLDPSLGLIVEGRNGFGLGSSGVSRIPGGLTSNVTPGLLGGSTTLANGNIVQIWRDNSGVHNVNNELRFTIMTPGLEDYASGWNSPGVAVAGLP